MEDVKRIVESARTSARGLVARAGERMLSGVDADRIHTTYVVRGLEVLGDIEVYAVLAAAGDPEAIAAIDDIRQELTALGRALEDERV